MIAAAYAASASFLLPSHRRALAQHQTPLRDAGHVVHREHRVAGPALEQAVVHHAQRTAAAFLGRLEDQVERAVEAGTGAALGQVLRRGQQDRGVAIVAAGVHHAANQAPDHAGAADAGSDLVAPGAQLVGHQRGGAVLVEGQLGVAVDVAPHAGELGGAGTHGVEQRAHGGFSHCGCRLIFLASAR